MAAPLDQGVIVQDTPSLLHVFSSYNSWLKWVPLFPSFTDEETEA